MTRNDFYNHLTKDLLFNLCTASLMVKESHEAGRRIYKDKIEALEGFATWDYTEQGYFFWEDFHKMFKEKALRRLNRCAKVKTH